MPAIAEAFNDCRVEVLVREEGEVERSGHAGSFTSQTESFFIDLAA